MKYALLYITFSVVLFSCGNNTGNPKDAAVNTPAPRSAIPKDLHLERFDNLESIFQNENWLLVDGIDSSYLYCSRLGKSFFRSYRYRMFKGDSVQTRMAEIKLASDSITWQAARDTTLIYLSKISPKEAVWADKANLQFYIYNKIDSNNIHVSYPDGSSKNLVRTPTLASFLVRSKYDYLHGTKLAFQND